MRFTIRLAFGLAIFLAIAGTAYALTAREYQGAILLLVCSLAFVYVGVSLRGGVRRSTHTSDTEDEEEGGAEELEEVSATIWPFVFSIAALALVVGAVGIHWVLILGAILFIAAAAGWFVDIQRQRMHADAGEVSALEGHEQHPDDHDRG
jgi:ABC-type Fe3+ transport system permease subunit